MRKTLLVFTYILLFVSASDAQFFLGLRSSNWGGITNVNYNPAIADSRFIADINLVNVGFSAGNNYIGLDGKALTRPSYFSNFDKDRYLHERLNGRVKSAFVGLQAQGPLSFMFSFGKKNRNAIALSYHINMVTNVDGIDEPLSRIIYYGVGSRATPFFKTSFSDKNVSIRTMQWADYGATYSRVVYDEGAHMVKVGGTLKLLQGLGAAYLYSNNLQYEWINSDTLNITNTDVSYGHSDNFNFTNDYKSPYNFKQAWPSFGADLAVVYEWRPNKDKYKYEMDGQKDLYRKDKNLYLLQAGFSVIDIGALNYRKGEFSRNFNADINGWRVYGFQAQDGLQSIDDTIVARFVTRPDKGRFTIWLPTRFNMWLDYQPGLGFGISAAATISPNLAPKKNMVHHVTTFTLNPHYDYAWFGAYLPFSYNTQGNYNLGLTLRMGPLIIGTQDLLCLFAKKWVYNADLHVALKVPIPYGMKHDKDKDHVSNRKDKCKKVPGPWENQGCPDRDGDGITDDEDKCPDNPGPKELNGCPDTDGDGVMDIEDDCVNEKGLAQFKGCPDRDGDGVEDKKDECPDTPGVAEFNGCPDRDGDGVPDRADLCPDVAGPKEHLGCPDTDGDGMYDNEDQCVTVSGPKENMGCPWPDTDGDGVLDKDDQCPKTPGPADNRGCPRLEKKELATIKYAFDNLEFETGKAVIRSSSYSSLNALAKLLIEKPTYGLRIDGHTDNVGTADKNLELSLQRANAVKTYLIDKGVAAGKLETNGYGLTKPVATNDTKEGRQKNRRVEMTVVFK